jgi:hypothetical protein
MFFRGLRVAFNKALKTYSRLRNTSKGLLDICQNAFKKPLKAFERNAYDSPVAKAF